MQAAVFSNDEYLPTFNRPNVTLVDVSESKGVERLTEKGIVANGVEYEVDCVIFASGFEITTEISRRYAIDVIEGRDGLSLFDHWRDSYQSLHGMTSRGFPNQFFTGFIQGGVSGNTTAMLEQQAEHIAYIIAQAHGARRDHRRAEPGSPGRLGQRRSAKPRDRHYSAFEMSCTPGYYNNEGGGGAEGNRSVIGDLYIAGLLRVRRPARRSGAPGVTWKVWSLRERVSVRFDDRVAVVTGAGRGLGRAYASLLAARGAKVVVNDAGGSLAGEGVDAGPAEQVVNAITAAGGEAVACTASVATRDGGEAIVGPRWSTTAASTS